MSRWNLLHVLLSIKNCGIWTLRKLSSNFSKSLMNNRMKKNFYCHWKAMRFRRNKCILTKFMRFSSHKELKLSLDWKFHKLICKGNNDPEMVDSSSIHTCLLERSRQKISTAILWEPYVNGLIMSWKKSTSIWHSISLLINTLLTILTFLLKLCTEKLHKNKLKRKLVFNNTTLWE